jgi:hypothetical protein
VSITIHVDRGPANVAWAFLRSVAEHPRAIFSAGARALRLRLQRHFRERDQTPNSLGGQRSHFWLDVYKSTQLGEITDRSGSVVVGDARYAQKVFGGTIRAKNVTMLAIPVDPEAYNRRPAVFEAATGLPLFLIPRTGGAVLATAGFGTVTPRYVLKKSVTQQPDPNAMPPREELEKVALEAAEREIQTQARRAQVAEKGSNYQITLFSPLPANLIV